MFQPAPVDRLNGMRSLKRPLPIFLPLLFVFPLYYYGAIQQLQLVNTDLTSNDQNAYMSYTRRLVESNYTYPGDGNRMPLYPLIQSLFYDTKKSAEASFTRGKYVNLGLSLILLTGIFLIIHPRLKWHATLNYMLITTFTVFMFKAPFFQAELLFYFLSLVFFLMMLRLFSQPSYLLAALTGVFVGLAYLTKASVTPGLLLFLLFIGLRSLRQLIKRYQLIPIKQALIASRPLLLVAPLVVIFFLITIYAQIRNNKEVFGRYFYNVNSTFYIWYDSWEEAKQGTRAHGDRVGWPEMPPEELPSPQKYLHEHTLAQILERFWSGIKSTVNIMSQSYGYLKYVLFYLLLLLFVAGWLWAQTKQLLLASPFTMLFALAYFSAYLLLYAWYTPINSGNRFTLALFLPLLYVLFRSLQTYHFPRSQILQRCGLDWLAAINLLVLAVLMVDIYLILTGRIVTLYGGS